MQPEVYLHLHMKINFEIRWQKGSTQAALDHSALPKALTVRQGAA